MAARRTCQRLAARECEANIFHWSEAVKKVDQPRRIHKFPTQASPLKQELPPSAVFRRSTYSTPMKSPFRYLKGGGPSSHTTSEPRCGNRGDRAANTSTNASGSTGLSVQHFGNAVQRSGSCRGTIIRRHSIVMGNDYLVQLLTSLGKSPEGYV